MSKSAAVKAEPRSELGSRGNKRLRDLGILPGVIYGHKEAVVPIKLPRKEVVTHINRGAHLFDLSLEGKSEKVLVKEVQYDHLGIEVLHIDFARVSLDEKVEVIVPIELKGEPIGEKDGGVLQQILNQLEVECLVTDIPDVIRVIVTDMKVDDVLHVRDLKLPTGVRSLQDGELIVATVKTIVEEAPAEAAVVEGAGEPEVIGKKEKDEADAAAAAATEAKK